MNFIRVHSWLLTPEPRMKLTYFGHSCFLVETAAHRLLIDPFFAKNPHTPVRVSGIRCDYVLVSHGHDDHCEEAVELARANDGTIVSNYEIANRFEAQGAKTFGLNPGGAATLPFGRLKLTLAHHSSGFERPDATSLYLGAPCGLLLTADGKPLYHAGDTALFLDMQLIGRVGLDIALLPIGDRFTMGIEDAVASLDFLRPKLAIPMHYNSF